MQNILECSVPLLEHQDFIDREHGQRFVRCDGETCLGYVYLSSKDNKLELNIPNIVAEEAAIMRMSKVTNKDCVIALVERDLDHGLYELRTLIYAAVRNHEERLARASQEEKLQLIAEQVGIVDLTNVTGLNVDQVAAPKRKASSSPEQKKEKRTAASILSGPLPEFGAPPTVLKFPVSGFGTSSSMFSTQTPSFAAPVSNWSTGFCVPPAASGLAVPAPGLVPPRLASGFFVPATPPPPAASGAFPSLNFGVRPTGSIFAPLPAAAGSMTFNVPRSDTVAAGSTAPAAEPKPDTDDESKDSVVFETPVSKDDEEREAAKKAKKLIADTEAEYEAYCKEQGKPFRRHAMISWSVAKVLNEYINYKNKGLSAPQRFSFTRADVMGHFYSQESLHRHGLTGTAVSNFLLRHRHPYVYSLGLGRGYEYDPSPERAEAEQKTPKQKKTAEKKQ